MVKISLKGKCQDIQVTADNGQPARCMIQVELDHSIPLAFHLYEIKLLVPTEFATLLEVGDPVTLTLEQDVN